MLDECYFSSLFSSLASSLLDYKLRGSLALSSRVPSVSTERQKWPLRITYFGSWT